MHVENAIRVVVDLGDLVGDQKDGDAVPGQLADDLIDAVLVADVDADRRAVEDQHLGVGGEPLGEHDPLLVAAGQGLDGSLDVVGPHGQPGDPLPRQGGPPRTRHEAGAVPEVTQDGERHVVGDRLPKIEPEPQPVLRDVGDTGGDGVLIRPQPQGRPVEQQLAPIEPRHPEERESQFGPAGAEQTRETQHLARVHGERDIVELARPRQSARFQHGLFVIAAARPERGLEPAARHQLGETVIVDFGCGQGRDFPAVAEHRNPGRDPHHLLEPVTDEHDGHPQLLEPPHDLEQALDLTVGQ